MRFLTCREEAEKERETRAGRLLRSIHEEMESVRFTGRLMFHDGQWCGIYGTPGHLKMRAPSGEFFPVEEG